MRDLCSFIVRGASLAVHVGSGNMLSFCVVHVPLEGACLERWHSGCFN